MVVHPAGVSDIVLIRAHRKGVGQLQPLRESFCLPEPVDMVFPGIAEPEKDADRRLRKVEPESVPLVGLEQGQHAGLEIMHPLPEICPLVKKQIKQRPNFCRNFFREIYHIGEGDAVRVNQP